MNVFHTDFKMVAMKFKICLVNSVLKPILQKYRPRQN